MSDTSEMLYMYMIYICIFPFSIFLFLIAAKNGIQSSSLRVLQNFNMKKKWNQTGVLHNQLGKKPKLPY